MWENCFLQPILLISSLFTYSQWVSRLVFFPITQLQSLDAPSEWEREKEALNRKSWEPIRAAAEKCLLRACFDFWPWHGEGLVDVPGGRAVLFSNSIFIIRLFSFSRPRSGRNSVIPLRWRYAQTWNRNIFIHTYPIGWCLAKVSWREVENAAERASCLRRVGAATHNPSRLLAPPFAPSLACRRTASTRRQSGCCEWMENGTRNFVFVFLSFVVFFSLRDIGFLALGCTSGQSTNACSSLGSSVFSISSQISPLEQEGQVEAGLKRGEWRWAVAGGRGETGPGLVILFWLAA